MKNYILGALIGAMAMALASCSVKFADIPIVDIKPPASRTQALPPVARQEPPQEETKKVRDPKIDFFSLAIPPHTGGREIKLGARPVNPQSIADLDRRLAGQTDLRVWHSPRRLYCKVQQEGGKWVEGWLPAGTQLLSRREGERNGITLWRVLEVARCGNPVEGVWVKEISPLLQTIIREREVVEQPVLVRNPEPRHFYGPTVGISWGWGGGGYYRSRHNTYIRRDTNVHIRRYYRR